MSNKKIIGFLFTLALLGTMSCQDDVETTYSDYQASFSITSVSTIIPLSYAINTPGLFCSITQSLDGETYRFTQSSNTQTVNKTAIGAYSTYRCIAGFIVGCSQITELGQDALPIVAYDLACPNCYRDNNIAKVLTLNENGIATCPRCKREYDLNNFGYLISDTTGVKLDRYHVYYYSNDALKISN